MARNRTAVLVERLADRENADIYVYSAQINFNSADRLRRLVCSRKIKRENVILFMTTYGGDPDSAYRIAACLRRNYKKISVCIFGICKSAGTLAAIGADQLVFGDFGELGPLDVQLTKPGEIYATGSGLDIFQAFQRYLLEIVSNSEGHISAKTSAEIARELAVGLFAPMTAQIEPERLGEVQRAINIARVYGQRLNKRNLKKDALDRLVQGYPTHGFVIDFAEAETLFNDVRRATSVEDEIAESLPLRVQIPTHPLILDLVDHHDIKSAPPAKGGGKRVTRAKAKRNRRRPSSAPERQAANVASLRPAVGSDATAAKRDADSRGPSAKAKAGQAS